MVSEKFKLSLLINIALFSIALCSSPNISFCDENIFEKIKKVADALSKLSDQKASIPEPEEKKSEKLINPEKIGDVSYEIYFNFDGQIFPGIIVSFIELVKKSLAKHRPGYMLGDYNGAFSVYAQGVKPDTKVRVIIFPNSLIKEQTYFDYNLPDPSIVYEITPMAAWDFQKLNNITQPTNDTFKIGIQVVGQSPLIKTFQPRIRTINDSILNYVDRDGKKNNSIISMFAAFVNENDPLIDQILKEAKDLGLKAKLKNVAFAGYQLDTIPQVALLWFLFQQKHFVYSSITQESGISSKVFAQHVRSLEDSYTATQANCVDGSVLFASILKKIGIRSFLVLKPGHCYLMFFSQPGKNPCFIETTMLGTYQVKKFNVLFHPAIAEYENSYKSFVEANRVATANFNKDASHYENKDQGYNLIDIDACREAGITPINK